MCHHRGGLFMAHVDAADAKIDGCLFSGRHRGTHDEEKRVYALLFERSAQQLGSGHSHEGGLQK
jgi:hypothetical protein